MHSTSAVTAVTLLAGALAMPFVGPPAAAQETSGPSPVEVVRERNRAVEEVLEAAGDSVGEAAREELKDVINGLMDFRELSKRALGRHWEERTPRERDEFVEVFRQLVRNSSVRKLGVYRADSVAYRPPEISGDEATVVTVAHRDRSAVEVVYHMHRDDGEWKAYDVVIDGSSTLRTYRDSFSREIAQTSYDAMYDRLVERLGRESDT